MDWIQVHYSIHDIRDWCWRRELRRGFPIACDARHRVLLCVGRDFTELTIQLGSGTTLKLGSTITVNNSILQVPGAKEVVQYDNTAILKKPVLETEEASEFGSV